MPFHRESSSCAERGIIGGLRELTDDVVSGLRLLNVDYQPGRESVRGGQVPHLFADVADREIGDIPHACVRRDHRLDKFQLVHSVLYAVRVGLRLIADARIAAEIQGAGNAEHTDQG